MKNNLILFVIFFIFLFILNSLFMMQPLFQGIGGCSVEKIFPCFISGKLWMIFAGFTLFDFVLYTIVFYSITILLFILTRSFTGNKYYKHILVFVIIKIILFAILFFREILPINFIYLFLSSFLLMYLMEVKLAYNELMVGNSRGRTFATLVPSGLIGLFKVVIYYVVYPIGLIIATWQMH